MSTILLVDNEPLQALQLKALLTRHYCDVQRVADPADALCLVEQPQFAADLGLVISALSMPGIGGPAFVAELHERLPDLPIIGMGRRGELSEADTSSWLRYLPRPFASGQILALVSELLKSRDREAA